MQEMGLIPSLFSIAECPHTQQPVTPGHTQGVYISLHPDQYEMILAKISGWFSGREKIELVDHGVSDKLGLDYIILEWIEHEIDPLFLSILRDKEIVADYTVSIHDLEEA